MPKLTSCITDLKIEVAVYGNPGSGKKTLVNVLNSSRYRSGKARFAFCACLGTSSTASPPVDVALVLFSATEPRIDVTPIIEIARGSASRLLLLQTKMDLVPTDYSKQHVAALGGAVYSSYRYKIDCIYMSMTDCEDVNRLLSDIVNIIYPQTCHQFNLARIASFLVDTIAWVFALPMKRLEHDVSGELATLADAGRDCSLQNAISLEWQKNIKRRVDVGEKEYISVSRIAPSLVTKVTGDAEEEAGAMAFAYRNTTIPVPRVHSSEPRRFTMDFVDGEMLYECWHKLSYLMQLRVACTLRTYIKQMRLHKHETAGSASASRSVFGVLFSEQRYRFSSAARFQYFCQIVAFEGWRRRLTIAEYEKQPAPRLPRPHIDWTPVFTHGDLNATNLVLDKQHRLWIIDWGMSGFYPASMESQSMRQFEDPPHHRLASWYRYRPFICGHASEDEEAFWLDFCSTAHRFSDRYSN